FNGSKVPCILVDVKSYDDILARAYGQAIGADTLLDIFYDGRDVFVDVQVNFRAGKETNYFFEKNYLLYANDMIEFFESLTQSGMMAIAPDLEGHSDSKVFMIQLPNKNAASRALEIIKTNAKS